MIWNLLLTHLCVSTFWKFSQVTGSTAVICDRQDTDVGVVYGTAARQFWMQMRSLSMVVSHADVTRKPVGSEWCILQMLMDVEVTALLLDTQATVPPFSLLKLWPGDQQSGGKVQCPSNSSDPFLERLSARDKNCCVTLHQVTCVSILFLKAALCSCPSLQWPQNCV